MEISNTLFVQVQTKPRATRVTDLSAGTYPAPPQPAVQGSPNVFVNNLPWVRVTDLWGIPNPLHPAAILGFGSKTVFINGLPAGRNGDFIVYPTSPLVEIDFADEASPNVFCG
jgi:uncharacterized Zn-binding protein involved in type VI secretion